MSIFFPCPRLMPLERRMRCTFQPSPLSVPESPAHAAGAAGATIIQKSLKLTPSHPHARMTQRPGKQPDLRDSSYLHADPCHRKPASNFQRNFPFFMEMVHGNLAVGEDDSTTTARHLHSSPPSQPGWEEKTITRRCGEICW